MTISETGKTPSADQTERSKNPELVRKVVVSSANSAEPFKKLQEDIQVKIIDGMEEALVGFELEFRGQWNKRSTDVRNWIAGTLAALRKKSSHDYDFGKGVKKTRTGIRLAQLAQDISDEFGTSYPSLLDPMRRVFQRSAETLGSGYTEYTQTREYRRKMIGTGFLKPGQTRSTTDSRHSPGLDTKRRIS